MTLSTNLTHFYFKIEKQFLYFKYFKFFLDNISFVQFETVPDVKNNIFAFGLDELQLTATVDFSKFSQAVVCLWQGLEGCKTMSIEFADGLSGCFFSSTCSSSLTCTHRNEWSRSKTVMTTALFRNLKKSVHAVINCTLVTVFDRFSTWNATVKSK